MNFEVWKSQGTEKKMSFFPYYSQNLSNETLTIADQEYANVSKFSLFDIKLQIKENNIA